MRASNRGLVRDIVASCDMTRRGFYGDPLMLKRHALFLLVLAWASIIASRSEAQMVHTSVPFQRISSGYSYGGSIGWNAQGPNWFANFGGGGPLLPPFGPNDPGGGLNGGFRFGGGGGVSGSLGFNFGQSSNQSIVSTTPSLTTTNGMPGSIFSGEVRPFVVGFTPVVGDLNAATAPLQEANMASRRLGQAQMSSLRQSQISLQDRKLAQYLQRAERAEVDGNKRMARANYRLAIAIAAEPLRSELQRRMKVMLAKPAE
jgi:hypothetical protein